MPIKDEDITAAKLIIEADKMRAYIVRNLVRLLKTNKTNKLTLEIALELLQLTSNNARALRSIKRLKILKSGELKLGTIHGDWLPPEEFYLEDLITLFKVTIKDVKKNKKTR